MLLNHVTGCTSFQDIRTLPNGTVCHTYKEAACHRGLLEDDNEYDLCLAMAASWHMPPQLRHLFVTILLYNEPCNPAALWEKYKYAFSQDFLHRARKTVFGIDADEHILNAALVDIDKRLQNHGKTIADYPGMPTPSHTISPYDEALIIQRELDYDIHEQLSIVDHDLPSLNSEQLTIFRTIISAVNDLKQCPKVFFIDGPGGTGKTFLYNTLMAQIRSQSQIALGLASSGIAALLLPGGRTVHSRLKVPIDINELSVCNIPKQSSLAQLIKRTKLLVWDEACMSNKHIAECVDRSLRDICSSGLPFGGKVMVFGGDFRQIPPVIKHGSRAEVVSACLNRSFLWRQVKVMKLTINMRLQILSSHDAFQVREFSNFLLRVGEGTEPQDGNQMIQIDNKFIIPGNSITDLVSSVYADLKENYADQDYISQKIILCPKNETADLINDYVIHQLPGDGISLLGADSVEGSAAVNFPTEYLNSITPNGMPPHRLFLKMFATVILLRNLDPDEGLCNGTRLIIRAFSNRVIDAEIATGVHKHKRVFIPRIILTSSESELPFILRRRQFPIRLAYCITINKGQGQSLETVGIYLPSPEAIFSHGQLYVAMSRVKNPLGLKIMVCGTDKSRPGEVWIRNVVYREIFDPHSQIEPIEEDIDEICSLLNDTFPSSQLTVTSPLLDTAAPAKRESVLSDSDGKSKVIKLNEFNDNTLIPLESIHVPMDAECVFDGILRDPQDFSQFLLNSSFNNFTIEMRQRLAHSIGIDSVFIQSDRETRRIATSYYISLHRQLMS